MLARLFCYSYKRIPMCRKRIALIPAYRPDGVLAEIAEELKDRGLDLVVVDDGSGEKYAGVFAETEKNAAVLRHEKNRGKGAALRTGLSYVAEHYTGPYTVVTVDADGQHRTADVMRVLQTAEEDRGGLVLGSRRFTGKVPLRSLIGNAVTRAVYFLASRCRVYDTQTGLRAFSDLLVPELLEIEGDRYEYEMNVLMTMARAGRPIREVWIETVYLNDNASSHFDAVKDSLRICREILKFSAASFVSFLTDYGLYCLLTALTGRLAFANVAARIVSASVNYVLNRRLVFQSRAPLARSIAQYAALAAVVLAGNTLVLRALAGLGWNPYLAKIVTELLFFILSWTAQRSIVFREKEQK